jgi:hypothetical protein
MIEYESLTTATLIELLLEEEDRVGLGHIEEIVRRGAAALPRLREILLNDDYWYEGQGGEFWINRHVVTLVSRIGDPSILPDLIARILPSYFADYDWLLDRWAEVLAGFGVVAVEPLIDFIVENRGGFRDNPDYSDARVQAARALTFIAQDHPEVRGRVLGFMLELLVDVREDDRQFLTSIVDCPLYLDRQQSLEPVKVAYRRGAIDAGLAGTYRELLAHITPKSKTEFFRRELLDFYRPAEIARRQAIWSRPDCHAAIEELESRGATWIRSAPFPPPLSHFYPDSPDFPDLEDRSKPSSPSGGASFGEGRGEKVGRNDPCPCGSGRKYKKCCAAA